MDETIVRQHLATVQFSNHILKERLQLDVQRYWAEELAKPRNSSPKRLLRYGFKVYSQCDEDGIIQEIFCRIGIKEKSFIEFGVQTGSECNTANLLLNGWHGLWIEGANKHVQTMQQSLKPFFEDNLLTLVEAYVSSENVNDLFSKAGFEGEIDLLSIDIDYNDFWVWKAVNIVRPRVVVIEYNSIFRPPTSVVVPYNPAARWDGSNYFGASLEALVRLGRSKGYRIVGCSFSGVNAFFVRDDLCDEHFFEPATAEEHYEPPRFFHVFQSGHRPRLGPYVTV